ncbi:MAG: hypothetical protein Q8O38_16940 [Sulfurimicrobium sp.]|nr:hypothetical protein [Sulfurimicrobium sp.]
MAMDVITRDPTTGLGAGVDANNNAKVNLPVIASQAGFASMVCEMDAGSITGAKILRSPSITEDGRLMVGVDTSLALYNFTTTAQNTGKLKSMFSTMSMTQISGFLNINAALSTISGNFAYLQSWKHFTLQGDASLHVDVTGLITAVPSANQVLEMGLFYGPAAGVAPADGVFFRLDSAGLMGIVSYGGVETSTGIMLASIPIVTATKFQMVVSQRSIEFWVDGVLGARLVTPAGNAVPYGTLNLPLCMMMRNTGTVTGGFTTRIGSAHVTLNDLATNKPWPHQMATHGNAYQGQDGDAQGQNALWNNNTAPTTAALLNTGAPFVGLGGIAAVLPTLTANSDGILFSFSNPLGSVTVPPKTLVVTGITIDSVVSVALVGGPVCYAVAAAFGQTSASLATAESASFAAGTTKSPRRVALGIQSYAAAADVGTTAQQIVVNFDSPLVVNPGEYFAILLRNVGVVTTAGAITFVVGVDHYYE